VGYISAGEPDFSNQVNRRTRSSLAEPLAMGDLRAVYVGFSLTLFYELGMHLNQTRDSTLFGICEKNDENLQL